MPAMRFPVTSTAIPAMNAPRTTTKPKFMPKYPVAAGMKTMIAAMMPLITPGTNLRRLNGVPESAQPSPDVVTAPSIVTMKTINNSISFICHTLTFIWGFFHLSSLMSKIEPEEITRIKRKRVLTDEDIEVLNRWQWHKVFGATV